MDFAPVCVYVYVYVYVYTCEYFKEKDRKLIDIQEDLEVLCRRQEKQIETMEKDAYKQIFFLL